MPGGSSEGANKGQRVYGGNVFSGYARKSGEAHTSRKLELRGVGNNSFFTPSTGKKS